MALLRSNSAPDPGHVVRGRRVLLRAPQMSDYPAWAELRAQSRDHLTPWEPMWARDELSRNAFRRRIRHYSREAREDEGYAFFILAEPCGDQIASAGRARSLAPSLRWAGPAHSVSQMRTQPRNSEPVLAGGITLSHVRRGVTQAATLGYWIGAPHLRRGLMSDAIAALLPFAFETLRLHRIEAAVMPANTPSRRVLERAGFTAEGVARRYLRINGRWEDHIIHARLAEDEFGQGGGAP